MQGPAEIVIPDHVPPELVLDYPLEFGAMSDKEPFSELVPQIHENPPVFYSKHVYPGRTPGWVVRRTADLRKVYLDTEHFSNKGFAPFARLIGENWGNVPAETDPPEHALYRAFVNPIFTPKAMAKLEEGIREIAREYIANFKAKGECEFMEEFAFEFPIKVFLQLMGLPLSLTPKFLEWEFGLLHSSDMAEVAQATRNVVTYLREQIADRRINPTDDLVTYGVQGIIDGRPLTDDELVGFTFNLFIGGLDTVSAHIGLFFRHLASHPEHQNTLRQNPAMIADAVDELMRAYGGVTTFRTCTKETQVAGVTIKPGDKVAMSVTLAGRDPEEYERPNEIILDRKPKSVSFAFGPHLCVGIHLARRELRIAMEEFLAAIPEFHIKPGAKITTYLFGVMQPTTLPLEWKA